MKKWTRERIPEAIRERHRRGRSLAAGAVQREASGLLKAARRIYSTWARAVRAAGLPPPNEGRGRPPRWTREKVLEAIRGRHSGGRSLSCGVVHREGGGLFRVSQRLFGSWSNALGAAGVPPPGRRGRPRKWTREEITRTIRKAARGHPRSWRTRLLRQTGGIYEAGVGVFGSWQRALRAAGIDPSRGSNLKGVSNPKRGNPRVIDPGNCTDGMTGES